MKTIALLGLVVAILPFLGIPVFWKTIIFVILGLVIFGRSFSYRGEINSKSDNREKSQGRVFIENCDCDYPNEEK